MLAGLGSRRTWLAPSRRLASEADKMNALVLVARCFQVNESAIEKWE